ncbi:MAG: DNA polymerase III subunit alpha [candidate division Zixibacteria bacterium]|nr:DNA polymerase III subunit alpha [candidate division Zixibacteria bacterium]
MRYPLSQYEKRLSQEVEIIKKMQFSGYFLIVWDFIRYARENQIPVGPGRGSVAGSLVSYAMRITDVDPLQYDLLFERFLNPERVSMPDIDIDFADRGRDKIIEYVIEKYGKDNVAQIITFGTMAARGVIRDVGRVLSIPYSEVDRIAKMIPFAVDMTLKRALKENPDIQKLADADERVAKLLDYAKRLEGLTRHASTHAAGVVIAPSALTDFVPLFSGSNGEITTQFDMKRVESIGLLKMDFLGLRTLTVIDDTVKMIARKTGEKFDIDSIPLDDPAVYRMFSRGETVGVFQFESPGMRDYLRKLNPESLEDLIAMNALYRPGPLDSGMINVYIDCKRKAKDVSYAHPLLEEILKSTYGVIVFQEQVLRIANSLAGYSMGSADILRKAMGKKDSKLMAEQEKGFIEGCLKNKIDKKTATTVFDQIETFARYGFNRAHSACYGYLAYQTAYLKVHHPLEFFAATMTSEIDSTDRIYILMEELRRSKIEILPPDVNKSNLEFAVSDGKIRFGMLAIKNVGEGCVKAIVSARETDGEFASMGDFVSRVNIKSVNRRALESLILSGALDSLPGTRAQKQETVQKALEFGSRIQQKSQSHDLFAGENGPSDRADLTLANAEPFTATKTLSLEKDALGFYLSGHPLDQYRREIKSFGATPASSLSELRDGSETRIAGSITAVKLLNDKRGNRMAFVTAEDFSGSVELICFSDCYERASGLITEGSLIMAIGRLSTREGESPKVLVNEVVALSRLAERFECSLILKLNQDITDERVDRALNFLGGQKGTTPVYLSYGTEESQALIRCGKFRVNPKEEALRELRHILGENEVFLAPRLN